MPASFSTLWAHPGVRWVTFGWVGFITENLVLSHNREWLIRDFGDDRYHQVYNVLSTAACGSIAFGMFKYGKMGLPASGAKAEVFLSRSSSVFALGTAVQTLGLVGLSQVAPAFQIPIWFGQDNKPATGSVEKKQNVPSSSSSGESKLYVRCPIDFKAKNPTGGIYGVERVSRHPALWFLGITALGGAMTTVYPTYLAVSSFPIIFSLIGSEHQDYRYRRGQGGQLTPQMESETSNIPFVALFQGKQKWENLFKETKWTNAAIAVVAAVGLAVRKCK